MFGEKRVTLYIDRGIVNCPRDGDTSLDRCVSCSSLRDVVEDRGYIECAPPPKPELLRIALLPR